MEFTAELTVRAELDVYALVEAEPYQIQWLLHGALFLTRHLCITALHFHQMLSFKMGAEPVGAEFGLTSEAPCNYNCLLDFIYELIFFILEVIPTISLKKTLCFSLALLGLGT